MLVLFVCFFGVILNCVLDIGWNPSILLLFRVFHRLYVPSPRMLVLRQRVSRDKIRVRDIHFFLGGGEGDGVGKLPHNAPLAMSQVAS